MATYNKLQERLNKKAEDSNMRSFWAGFQKKAEENFVSAEKTNEFPGAPEKMLKFNINGGVDPRTPEDLQTAQAAGLVTLPREIEGASCGTCMHFRPITEKLQHGFCTNPAVKQDVTGNMHCINWEHPGSHNAAEAAAEEAQAAQVEQAQAAQQGMDPTGGQAMAGGAEPGAEVNPANGQAMAGGQMAQKAPAQPAGQAMAGGNVAENTTPAGETGKPSAVGTQSGFPAGAPNSSNPLAQQALSDFQGESASAGPAGGPEGAAPAPKKPAKKKESSSDKKDSSKSSKGHTININVDKGSEKTSSFDFWKGIVEGY